MNAETLPTRTLEWVLGLTAFTAGTVDILTFARMGGILASAMTGNLAFLGYFLSRFAFAAAFGSFLALCGFVAGSAIGTLISRGRAQPTALKRLLITEAALLVIAVIVWFTTPHLKETTAGDIVIACLSLSMGLQSITGKRVNLSNIPTVVFTSTLTNIVMGVIETMAEKRSQLTKDTTRQVASFMLYFVGALAAGLCAYLNWMIIILLPAGAIGAALWVCAQAVETAA